MFENMERPSSTAATILKIVVGQHHVRGLFRYVSPGDSHGYADSAALRAGASLTPSPVMATTRPAFDGPQFATCARVHAGIDRNLF